MTEIPPPVGLTSMKLLFRDEHVAAFEKPSGLLVHRGWGNDAIVALDLARNAMGFPVFPVHRLDRGTSGVLLFSLNAASARAMGALFAEGGVKKRYLALVRGITPEQGRIDHPIPRTEGGPRVPAVTTFRRLCVFERYSLVEALPETGRLHQVRRHMKHISHPIIGDANYGKGDINRAFRERFGLHRLALHALEISFVHPFTEQRITISSPIPADLREPFMRMGIPSHLLEDPLP